MKQYYVGIKKDKESSRAAQYDAYKQQEVSLERSLTTYGYKTKQKITSLPPVVLLSDFCFFLLFGSIRMRKAIITIIIMRWIVISTISLILSNHEAVAPQFSIELNFYVMR